MKYHYNHNINDVVLVTDDKERKKSRVTRFILELLHNNGLNPITTKRFDGEQLRENNEFYFNRDKKVFKKSFDYVTEPISLKTLIKFSRQKPELQQALREEPLAMMKILWKEYKRRFRQSDSLHEIVI